MAKSTRDSSEPMGGLQLIMCGDFFQLPPIMKSSLIKAMSTSSSSSSVVQRPTHLISKTNSYHATNGAAGAINGLSQWPLTQCANIGSTQELTSLPPPPPAAATATATTTTASLGQIDTTESSLTRNRSRYCFQSTVWSHLVQKCYVLRRVFRQEKDETFASLLETIRLGTAGPEEQRQLNMAVGRELSCEDGILPTRIYTHRYRYPYYITNMYITHRTAIFQYFNISMLP